MGGGARGARGMGRKEMVVEDGRWAWKGSFDSRRLCEETYCRCGKGDGFNVVVVFLKKVRN